MVKKYDVIVIGAGQAGPAIVGEYSQAGYQTAIIERGEYGGTCVNTGCVPSKTLIASAETAHIVRNSEEMGITINGDVKVDMKKVKFRMDAIRKKYRQGLQSWLENLKNCTVYHGTAQFEDRNTIRVNDDRLTADKIFINVGARPFARHLPGLDQISYLTSSRMLDIDFVPEHLVIVGGSYVGLEFAQMYRRFGSKVSVVEMNDRLISREDEDVSAAILNFLEKEGIEFRLQAKCISLKKRDNKVVVHVDCAEAAKEVIGTHLLLAIGREPNTDDLGLDKAGIKTDKDGYIMVNDQLETNVPGIWALGECNRRGAFTHTAYNDADIVISNLFHNEKRSVKDRILTYALFVDPPLGRAGLTELEVRQSGRKALIGKLPMKDIKRAVIKNESDGFMKVLIDAETKQILGAAVLGVGGDEIIHSLLDVMYTKAPYTIIKNAVHIHPTVAELIPTMLSELGEL